MVCGEVQGRKEVTMFQWMNLNAFSLHISCANPHKQPRPEERKKENHAWSGLVCEKWCTKRVGSRLFRPIFLPNAFGRRKKVKKDDKIELFTVLVLKIHFWLWTCFLWLCSFARTAQWYLFQMTASFFLLSRFAPDILDRLAPKREEKGRSLRRNDPFLAPLQQQQYCLSPFFTATKTFYLLFCWTCFDFLISFAYHHGCDWRRNSPLPRVPQHASRNDSWAFSPRLSVHALVSQFHHYVLRNCLDKSGFGPLQDTHFPTLESLFCRWNLFPYLCLVVGRFHFLRLFGLWCHSRLLGNFALCQGAGKQAAFGRSLGGTHVHLLPRHDGRLLLSLATL